MSTFDIGSPILTLAVFPFLWAAALYFLSLLSGWAVLAEHYRSDKALFGSKSRFRSMSIGRGSIMDVNFSSVVTLETDTTSIAISLFFPFSFFHPRLVIPLTDLTAEEHRYFGFIKMVRLSFARSPAIKITASRSWVRWIEENSNRRWQMSITSGANEN